MLLMMIIMVLPVLGLVLFFILPLAIALPAYLACVAVSLFYHWLMMSSQKRPVETGRRGMIGLRGKVLTWHGESGEVECRGEIWKATAEAGATLRQGEYVEVVGFEGMTLLVRPVHEDGAAS